MKLTCLNTGKGYHFPACHLLQMCGVRILLECPLDLSALHLFVPLNRSSDHSSQPRKQRRTTSVTEKCKHSESSPFKYSEDFVLIDAEPWYKTADELHLWDLSLIDVVLVSSPAGMLGLPYLTRNKRFTAKIYATEATTKVGQLTMEELLAMHLEFVQLYGPSKTVLPLWLDSGELEAASVKLRERVLGKDGTDIGNWHHLYSAADAKECVKKVHTLRFAEEICYNDTLIIKAISSGLEIGASNWTVTGPRRSLTYFTGSIIGTGHAMGLDIPSLQGTDLVLFSDFSSMSECDKPAEAKDVHEKHDTKDHTYSAVPKFRYKFPMYGQIKSMDGTSHAQGLQQSADISSPCPGRNSIGMLDTSKSQERQTICSTSLSSEVEKTTGIEPSRNSNACETSLEKKKFDLICGSTIKAIKAGGSVLIPISRMGYSLQLVEEVSLALQSTGVGQVPIFYVSPTAEETLAYANTIPEWLNKQRQEKLYAGEALFGHIGLMADKRLYSFAALHSPELVNVWQEPCIMFTSHWSLRVGPTMHLLHRWKQNPTCLLVIVEDMIDVDLLLSPFKPMAMKLLHCPFLSGLRSKEIVPLVKKLQPKLVLFPEALQKGVNKIDLKEHPTSFYCKGQTLRIPSVKDDIEVDMATDLAFQLRPKQVGQGNSAVAKVKAELHIEDGRLSLRSVASSSASTSLTNQQSRGGQIHPDVLLAALKDSGTCASVEYDGTSETFSINNKDNDASRTKFVVNISTPSKATIEVKDKHVVIKADDAATREHIVKVVKSIAYAI